MSSSTIVRIASRSQPSYLLRTSQSPGRRLFPSASLLPALPTASRHQALHTSVSKKSANRHGEETFEEFTARVDKLKIRYENEFNNVQDVFELQRNLNNSFAYDLVPSPSVCTAALRAARRVNDFPTAVRIFEGIKVKVENKGQYNEYLKELQPLREELGIDLAEDLYPDPRFRAPRW